MQLLTHPAEALKIPMKDIGTALVANIDLLTEFSCSVEATATMVELRQS